MFDETWTTRASLDRSYLNQARLNRLRLNQASAIRNAIMGVVVAFAVAGLSSSAWSQDGQTHDSQGEPTAGFSPSYSQSTSVVWEFGLRISFRGEYANKVQVAFPVPVDWPEQECELVKESKSDSVGKFRLIKLGKGACVTSFVVSRMGDQDTAEGVVRYRIKRKHILRPEDTARFRFPGKMRGPVKAFLKPSPSIESRDKRIVEIGDQIFQKTEGSSPWEQVEAIYAWVRENVDYQFDPTLRSCLDALDSGHGDCEELSSLFIAICRSRRIPARAVWVPGHTYPEFYLEDEAGNGHWFPCQVAGADHEFGEIQEQRPILQKGDRFKLPHVREIKRYVEPTIFCKDRVGELKVDQWMNAKVEEPVQQKRDEAGSSGVRIKVLSFNVLYGGSNAAGVGFPNKDFGGSRIDEMAEVILQSGAEIVGIQEDASTDVLLDELNKGDRQWFRYGSVYSTFKLTGVEKSDRAFGMTVCKVAISDDLTITFVNTHWHPSPYGPAIIQDMLKEDPDIGESDDFEKVILAKADKPNGYRGYNVTIEAIKNANQDAPIILTGDFNESSHLDWTERFAEEGFDRWFKNSTATPLRFKISWSGSKRLQALGLGDAYRTVYPDEVKNPGLTFTPPYPAGTPGRRAIADQILDRIDIIYFSKSNLKPLNAAVIGESETWSDRVYSRRWPSDHRAVFAELQVLGNPR